jgi:hypothetical protein
MVLVQGFLKQILNMYTSLVFVIPAKAGIQRFQRVFWMPAPRQIHAGTSFAGMTKPCWS